MSRVVMHLPGWLAGGVPADFLGSAGLRGRRVKDAWEVETVEGYYRRQPKLISHVELIGGDQPALNSSGWSEVDWSHLVQAFTEQEARTLIAQAKKSVSGEQLLDLLNMFWVSLPLTPAEHVQELVETAVTRLRVTEADGEFPMAGASVHLVGEAPALSHRLELPGVLSRLEIDHTFDAAEAARVFNEGRGRAFRGGEALQNGRHMLEAYLAPLMGALSPSVWGHTAPLPGLGTLILGFGEAFNGQGALRSRLIDTIATQMPQRVRRAHVTPAEIDASIRWWVDRLNHFFGVLGDPSNFVDGDGKYLPERHRQELFTVEYVFRRVAGGQAAYLNQDAAVATFFSVMDTFEGLLGKRADSLYDPDKADQVLAALEDIVPVAAAPLILHSAQLGARALRSVADEFFLLDEEGLIPVPPTKKGAIRRGRTPAKAVPHYLSVRRNALHGYWPKKGSDSAEARELLERHTGVLPDALPHLAYLYLLDLLCHPDRFKAIVRRR